MTRSRRLRIVSSAALRVRVLGPHPVPGGLCVLLLGSAAWRAAGYAVNGLSHQQPTLPMAVTTSCRALDVVPHLASPESCHRRANTARHELCPSARGSPRSE
jgi:hypothetical protein